MGMSQNKLINETKLLDEPRFVDDFPIGCGSCL